VLRSPLRVDRELIGHGERGLGIFLKVVRIGIPTGIQVVMVSLSEIASSRSSIASARTRRPRTAP